MADIVFTTSAGESMEALAHALHYCYGAFEERVAALAAAQGVPWPDPQPDDPPDAAALADMCRVHALDLAHSVLAREGVSGPIVGIALLGRRGDRGWLGDFAVAPQRRGQGLGHRLMTAFLEQARALGIRVAERQPFPGPALAVRVLGEVTPERVALAREASAIVEEELEAAAKKGLMSLPWQYFAVLLPVQSVGVHGDQRVYGHTIAVRAIDSVDGMSGKYSKIPHEVLDIISVRITNEVKGINRVVYDVSNKPPATIEWE